MTHARITGTGCPSSAPRRASCRAAAMLLACAACLATAVVAAAQTAAWPDAPASDDALGQASVLRLRASAAVQRSVLRLSDVLDLSAASPELRVRLQDEALDVGVSPPAEVDVSFEVVDRLLGELGVNRTRVLLSGAMTCRVSWTAASDAVSADAASGAEPAWFRTPDAEAQAGGVMTLGEAIRRYVQAELGEAGLVEIEFEHAAMQFVRLTSPPFEFSIRASRGPKLGLREFRVSIRQDGKLHHSVQAAANVRLKRRALVAVRPLNIGTNVARDSVMFAERVFSDDSQLGYDRAEAVIGQRVARFVPEGQLLTPADIDEVELVKRSRPVTVLSDGPIAVRAAGVALDSGGFGETVRVRLGESRRERREMRAVVVGVATVRLSEEES